MVEGVEQLLRQGRVEVLRDPDSTSQETRSATWALPLQRPEPRYRLASPGDDDLRAASCLVDQTRQVRLRRVDIHDPRHGLSLVWSPVPFNRLGLLR